MTDFVGEEICRYARDHPNYSICGKKLVDILDVATWKDGFVSHELVIILCTQFVTHSPYNLHELGRNNESPSWSRVFCRTFESCRSQIPTFDPEISTFFMKPNTFQNKSINMNVLPRQRYVRNEKNFIFGHRVLSEINTFWRLIINRL